MSEKLCVFCKHMEFDYELAGGGCDTCGYGGEGSTEMTCNKGHWSTDIEFSLKDYREKILTAARCPDYSQVQTEEQA